jgi:hypothetical protein
MLTDNETPTTQAGREILAIHWHEAHSPDAKPDAPCNMRLLLVKAEVEARQSERDASQAREAILREALTRLHRSLDRWVKAKMPFNAQTDYVQGLVSAIRAAEDALASTTAEDWLARHDKEVVERTLYPDLSARPSGTCSNCGHKPGAHGASGCGAIAGYIPRVCSCGFDSESALEVGEA